MTPNREVLREVLIDKESDLLYVEPVSGFLQLTAVREKERKREEIALSFNQQDALRLKGLIEKYLEMEKSNERKREEESVNDCGNS